MKQRLRRILFLISTVMLVLSTFLSTTAIAETQNNTIQDSLQQTSSQKIDSKVKQQMDSSEELSLIIILNEQIDAANIMKQANNNAIEKNELGLNKKHMVRSKILTELKANAHQTQAPLLELLSQEKQKGKVKKFKSYHVINAISFTGSKEVIEKIASFKEVKKIYLDEERNLVTDTDLTTASSDENVQWNVNQVLAPQAWELGIDGTGAVVASIDSGVQWDHPALKEKYRGYNAADGTVDHQYSFFDAVSGQAESYDDNGHGTHVTGTMVGSEPDGTNKIGVAPGAKWIAAKAFDANGSGSDSDILEAAEWIMAPGGRVDMAPDVVNNSWSGGPGINEWFLEVVQTWRAYGIFPVFAAGNASILDPNGPGTIASPANYPESFAVGAVDEDDVLADFSFQGPSPYGEIKPELTAPGVNIRSTLPDGGYEDMSGTSMAAPHIAGALALLRQANANVTVDEMEQILIETATPLTDQDFPESPNHGYGYGLLNAYDAVLSETQGMGMMTGNVTIEGEDTEDPVYTHTPISEVSEGLQIDLTVQASDNISVESVELAYKLNDGEWNHVSAERISGDYLNGEYLATIPAGVADAGTLTYQWTITDYAGNTVMSEEYLVTVLESITIGYSEDFETEPAGWTIVGENPNWEWGTPTSGPNGAASGEKVYATNLSGDYSSGMREMLVMPPIVLPDGQAFLQFNQWYSFEQSAYTGTAYDYGYVMVSTNGQDWTELSMVKGDSGSWVDASVDLSEYAGQGIFIAFYTYSDFSTEQPGWYIDDVALSATNNGKSVNTSSDPATIHTSDFADINSEVETDNSLSLLPVEAQVSVMETGRSVVTNPQNGSYALRHPAGEFNVVAESYGYHSQTKTIEIADDEEVTTNFTLQEKARGTITGVITDELTGEPVEGAKVYLVEDANIEPVETNANGSFSLTAFEGTYTLKVSDPMHYPNTAEVTVVGNEESVQNIALPPIVGTSETIAYDDGTAESLNYMHTAGNGWAVEMSLEDGKNRAVLTGGYYKFDGGNRPDPGGTEFLVEVYDSTGPNGLPGEKIAGPFEAEALRSDTDWTFIDLSGEEIIVEGDFYLAYIQKDDYPYTPAINRDTSSESSERNYSYIDGVWKQTSPSDGNYMIRAVVAYDEAVPEITSPLNNLYTAENTITVEGQANPNTEIHLYNNGSEVAVVSSTEDGAFSAEISLTEGTNAITARATQGESLTRPSNQVEVILDSASPIVSINSPQDGEQFNTTSVTVQAQVEEENLEGVTINGSEAALVNGNYEAGITLEQGENSISVTAKDKAGNETVQTITVNIDSVAPIITIESPEDGDTTHKKSVKVEGQISEANLEFIRVNGKDTKVKNGSFRTNVKLEDGENIIMIWSKDTFGNETWEEVRVIYAIKNGKGK
ncbi:S8 family serine peptidase [Tenuibacillus multivorans]|uniref:Bacillopeptidase F n=1 Tax=Tenuibacillus multivorans TaxID=237069 RepID=A0A1H0EQK3_9BACI|nr:S8 family serine peptidase [Tenuibacillus multivorans]GEL76999.1 bacillopeptidase F [Tenuibacillus multivorans]SDN84616.1 bacillopeptidase F [Tenuibacillus multivorans]